MSDMEKARMAYSAATLVYEAAHPSLAEGDVWVCAGKDFIDAKKVYEAATEEFHRALDLENAREARDWNNLMREVSKLMTLRGRTAPSRYY